MALDHLAVLRTELGLGALVHRSCLESSGGAELDVEVEQEDLELELGGCALCGESLAEAS